MASFLRKSQGQKLPIYGTTTGPVATGGTALAVASIATMWKTSALQKQIEVYRISLTIGFGSTSNATSRNYPVVLSWITAENGTPGGTQLFGAPLNRSSPASAFDAGVNGIIRSRPAIPTRDANEIAIIGNVSPGLAGVDQYTLFDVVEAGEPLILLPNDNIGLEVWATNPGSTVTAYQPSVTFFWAEREPS